MKLLRERKEGMLLPSPCCFQFANTLVGMSSRTVVAFYYRIIFVKTHKTGGSTVATLLHRFARLQNASVFVPPPGYDAHK
jgi:hypothetical protein